MTKNQKCSKSRNILHAWFKLLWINHLAVEDNLHYHPLTSTNLWINHIFEQGISFKMTFLRHKVYVSTIQSFRFYDTKFAFLRHKVSISTIKRLRFYDTKFPFYRSNGVCFYVKQMEYLWIYLNYIKHNVFYSNMHISYSILVPKVL